MSGGTVSYLAIGGVLVGTIGILAANLASAPPRPPTSASLLPAGAVTCQYRAGGALPDPTCTPGVTNPAVRQDTIGSTICQRGWTATVRPPVEVTEPMKLRSMAEYGVSGAARYQYDHYIPLELGGDPSDRRNLWPLMWEGDEGARAKDRIAGMLRARVCAGRMTLADAQHIISIDWRQAV